MLKAVHTVESARSTYQFTHDIPLEIAMGEWRQFNMTLSYLEKGDIGYDNVRVKIDILQEPAESSVEIWAEDDTGGYNLVETGFWGPGGGFPIGPDYEATTPVEVIFHNIGHYAVKLTLIDVADDNKEITSETIEVDVVYPLTLDWDDDVFGSSLVGETITVNTSATRNTENSIKGMYYVIKVYKGDNPATSDDVEAIAFGQDSQGGSLPSEGVPVAYSETPGVFYFGDPVSGFTFGAKNVSNSFRITFKTSGEYKIEVWAEANELPLD
jgi:hypothetical protein